MASNSRGFLMRGKLGDFIQSLYALKIFCETNKTTADLYMYDLPSKIGWEFGIENTYRELYDIMMSQEYINSFSILNSETNTEGFIELGDFIHSPLLYNACWSEIFSNLVQCQPIPGAWMKFDTIDDSFANKVLIHRRHKYTLNNNFPYESLVKQNKDNIIFISTSESDYENFPWKDDVDFYKIETMTNWFTCIRSCRVLISNISAPACIANALDVPRIIELPDMMDSYHWMGEQNYSNNMFWLLDNNINHLPI